MKALLLYAQYTDQFSYFDDWLDAFKGHPSFKAKCINVLAKDFTTGEIIQAIKESEVIILHHSMNADTLDYLNPFLSPLKHRKGKLVSFVGNEINLPHMGMVPKIKVLKDLETDIIATQLLEEAGKWLYQDCVKSKVIALPHALNPEAFHSQHSFKNRNIDIGTRSARYSVYMGDNDRNEILSFFQVEAKTYSLNVDLGLDKGSQQRFDRHGWSKFLEGCKATISTEAGTYYLERDDQTVQRIHRYLISNTSRYVLPHESYLRKLYRFVVPSSLRKQINALLKDKMIESYNVDQSTDFDKIHEMFFLNTPKCPVYSKAISSRHFDAIGTKTLHILYPGRYNDILKPGEHYFELQKDHSNIDALIDLIKDEKTTQKIVNNVYEYVRTDHTHQDRLNYLAKFL
jgi:spore maturation protein CgeB